MAHFAEIIESVVQRVIVVHDDDEANGAQFCHDLLGGEWLRCNEFVAYVIVCKTCRRELFAYAVVVTALQPFAAK